MEPEAIERITLPLLLAVAATRVLGGIGLGLLLADRMDRESRRAVGRALLAAGIASSVPLLRRALAAGRHAAESEPTACAMAIAE